MDTPVTFDWKIRLPDVLGVLRRDYAGRFPQLASAALETLLERLRDDLPEDFLPALGQELESLGLALVERLDEDDSLNLYVVGAPHSQRLLDALAAQGHNARTLRQENAPERPGGPPRRRAGRPGAGFGLHLPRTRRAPGARPGHRPPAGRGQPRPAGPAPMAQAATPARWRGGNPGRVALPGQFGGRPARLGQDDPFGKPLRLAASLPRPRLVDARTTALAAAASAVVAPTPHPGTCHRPGRGRPAPGRPRPVLPLSGLRPGQRRTAVALRGAASAALHRESAGGLHHSGPARLPALPRAVLRMARGTHPAPAVPRRQGSARRSGATGLGGARDHRLAGA